MADFKSRLTMMSEMRKKHLTQLRANQLDSSKDKNGSASSSLVGTLRFLAVSEYVLHSSKNTFTGNLTESAELQTKLFSRFEVGESISPSYVSMMSYKALLNALASGNEECAKNFASKMGGRPDIEKEYDRPFDIAFGYALKLITLSDLASAAQWVDALEIACKDAENTDFMGYAKVLRATINSSLSEANAGLIEVVAGHKRQSSGKGLFKDTEDELLCVWGIAVTNLARMRGLNVSAIEPLIPSDLLLTRKPL
jgi:hypothetical protein